MKPSTDVLILGGGVIGLSTAYFLAREGVRVEIVDKGDFGQEASWAGAGILPPGNRARASTPYEQMRGLSAELFPVLSAELRERTGVDNGYFRCGGLDLFDRWDEAAAEEWRQEAIIFEVLDAKKLAHLEPALAPARACLLPDMAQVRNPRHLKALVAGCVAAGVKLRPHCPVLGLERRGSRLTGVRAAEGRLHAERYFLTAGAWSESLLNQVGWQPGIRPIRGQIALLNAGMPLFRRIVLHGKCYLVPRPDGRILVGSTEEDVGFDRRTTAAAIGGLLRLAVQLAPGLAGAHIERCWAGLRPGSPDGLPYIGPVPGVDNLVVAAGHFRSGILLSLATAQVLTELYLGRPPSVPLEAFRLDRSPAPPARVAFRS